LCVSKLQIQFSILGKKNGLKGIFHRFLELRAQLDSGHLQVLHQNESLYGHVGGRSARACGAGAEHMGGMSEKYIFLKHYSRCAITSIDHSPLT
jgi:hypothetical protein